jgi:hypothetical protein
MAWTDGVVIFLTLFLIAVFPAWPHSRNWGYAPSAGISICLLILLIVLVAQTV